MQFLNEMYVRLATARDESGQGLAEYGLILALVAIICVGALTALQGGIDDILTRVEGALRSGS